jgi:hypothetical protein
LLLWEIAAGEAEEWSGAEINRETIYGGSRVEIGGGRINGDGSIGAWASEFELRYGNLVNKRYEIGGKVMDLTGGYSESRCRDWGRNGVPDFLESEARLHPVTASALVRTKEEGWAAIGAGKPIPICSNRGFTTRRDSDGFCSPSGTWNHCMATRGRFLHPRRGRSVVIGNSWGDYLGSSNATLEYVTASGQTARIELPPGHFATTWDVWGGMLSQRDSFAVAGFKGWEAVRVDYTP